MGVGLHTFLIEELDEGERSISRRTTLPHGKERLVFNGWAPEQDYGGPQSRSMEERKISCT
jgi:hypothetical protein